MRRSIFHALLLSAVAVGGCNCDEGVVNLGRPVNGRVCTADGAPLANADVTATPKTDKGKKVVRKSDDQGDVSLVLFPDGYTISAPGRPSFDIDVPQGGDAAVLFDDPACRPPPVDPTTCTVVGSICNRHTGELVQEGEVFVLLPDGSIFSDVTDSGGHFTLENLPPGEHVLTVRAPSFTRSFLVQCEAGQEIQLAYGDGCDPTALNEGNVQGYFCDPATGGNLVGADVTATHEDDANLVYREVTDTDGKFFLNGMALGRYMVQVFKPSAGINHLVEATVEAGVTTTVLDPSECADRPLFGALEGRVCADSGGGFYVGRLELFRGAQSVDSDETDAQGRFRFDALPPGQYTVKLLDSPTQRTYTREVLAEQTTAIDESLADCESPPQEVCATIDISPSETQDGRIYLVVDRSGSMDEDAQNSTGSKWEAMRAALSTVTQQLDDAVEFGMILYPSPDVNDACATGTEEVPIGPNTGTQIALTMNEVNANGNTPTAASLRVAKQRVEPLLADGRPISVLLATDGAPNCRAGCSSPFGGADCPDANGLLQAVQELRNMGVLTYVVGVQSDSTFHDVLNEAAVIGGTELPGATKYYDASDPVRLEEALRAVVQRTASCRVDVADSLYAATSVSVKVGDVDVQRDTTRTNGWDIVSAFTIELYGSACAMLTDTNATIEQSTVHVTRCETQ